MFWKLNNVIKKLISYLIYQRDFTWSITFRLAFTYTLSALFILLSTAFTLYWVFTTRLEKDNANFLINNMIVLQKTLEKSPIINKGFMHEEIVLEPEIYHYYIRVIDNNGKVVLATPGMEKIPLSAFRDLIPISPDDFPKSSTQITKNHVTKQYLLMSTEVNSDKYKMIQIAKDISGEYKLITDYKRSLFLILIIGIILTAIIGTLVTRKGLKPLRDITKSTQRISISRLKERLNPLAWPKEFSELSKAFNAMLDRIEEGFLRISYFSGDLAHELRTPITNLRGEAEIILSRPRTNEEYREVIESSLEEFERLSYMVDNLLFLARAEKPHNVLIFSTVEVKTIMQNIADFYEAIAEEKGVKIYCEGNALIKADSLMINRAINNIVSNALNHTPAKGAIILKTWIADDRSCCISITDNGEGIAKEHLPHLFDRFYRVDSARSKQSGGSGLGLAIVRFIMDLHLGDVTIKSEINVGTTITLVFPHTLTL